jgi:acyl-CoA reductase-like NAD-dependent aldehyde dehydrogenase
VDAHIDDAIAYVNDSTMGLGATLRSSDPALIKRCFEEAKVGTVWINDPLTDNSRGRSAGEAHRRWTGAR